jgi:hypothetical protein
MNQRSSVRRLFFATFLVLIGTIDNTTSVQAQPQTFATSRKHLHIGFDVAFGTKSFLISSDITELNQLKVLEEGGSGGVVVGNDIIELNLRQGYYYSAARVAYTVDLVESEADIAINIFGLIMRQAYKVQPYALLGIERNSMGFYGFYASKPDSEITAAAAGNSMKKRNYSTSQTPVAGKVVAIRAAVGLGFSYTIPIQYSFVKLYSEVNYGYPVHISSEQLKNTTVSNQVTMNVGVSFGVN